VVLAGILPPSILILPEIRVEVMTVPGLLGTLFLAFLDFIRILEPRASDVLSPLLHVVIEPNCVYRDVKLLGEILDNSLCGTVEF
jgi:hypothetical protein